VAPKSEVRLGKAKVNPGVDPTGYGRHRGDAGAYPMEDFMALWPAAPGPGSVGAAPWARPDAVRCLDGEGQRVITGAPTWGRSLKSYLEAGATGPKLTDPGDAIAAAAPSGKDPEVQIMDVDPEGGEVGKGYLGKDGARSTGQSNPAMKLTYDTGGDTKSRHTSRSHRHMTSGYGTGYRRDSSDEEKS